MCRVGRDRLAVGFDPEHYARSMVQARAHLRLQRRRIVLAFLATPLLAPFYAAIFFAQPWSLPIGLVLTYPTALLFGLPAFFALRHFAWLQWWQLAAAGALCSVPALILYCWIGTPPHLEAFSAINAAALVGWGVVSGLCFWALGIWGESPLSLRSLIDLGPPG